MICSLGRAVCRMSRAGQAVTGLPCMDLPSPTYAEQDLRFLVVCAAIRPGLLQFRFLRMVLLRSRVGPPVLVTMRTAVRQLTEDVLTCSRSHGNAAAERNSLKPRSAGANLAAAEWLIAGAQHVGYRAARPGTTILSGARERALRGRDAWYGGQERQKAPHTDPNLAAGAHLSGGRLPVPRLSPGGF